MDSGDCTDLPFPVFLRTWNTQEIYLRANILVNISSAINDSFEKADQIIKIHEHIIQLTEE